MINQIPANTWIGISEKVKEFFENNVAKDFLLQLQDTEDDPQYREPYVDLQTLPHKNFIPPDVINYNGKSFQAPYILVQTYNLRTNDDIATLSVRAVFGVYASGNYETEDLTLNMPDNKAYIDLMNIIQKAMTEVNTKRKFGNAVLTDSDITADIYDLDVPPYPYSYGYMEFDVQYNTSQAADLIL